MGEKNSAAKYVLITISIVFVGVMLVLPLIAIIVNSLQRGWEFYIKSLTSRYVLSALKVTAVATISALIINTFFGVTAAWLLTKFSFRGKHILATLIDIPFSISPVIAGLAFIMTFGRMGWAATVFVTFPFISREIVPILNAQGKDEEEAAALMGADGFTIFRKITLPHIKWGLLYGIILCTARALGEFGAVNALSKARGGTFTLPLEIDALYLSGSSESITAAFAVSSLLVMISIFILIIKNIVEHKSIKKGI